MTAATLPRLRNAVSARTGPRRNVRFAATPRVERTPLSARVQMVRAALLLVVVLTVSLLTQLLLVSPLQQRSAQQTAFDRIRSQLANGTAPLAAGDLGKKKGEPVAYLEVPSIGLRQVVVEGSDAGELFKGPGHRRDTPIPGQSGISVILGRRAAFGGPFAQINTLKKGATIRATTGAGVFDYRVLGVRSSGDPAPAALTAGAGRIVLVTASGAPFVPAGLTLVDADLIGPGVGGARPVLTAKTLPDAEKLLSIDTRTLWRLVLWLQVLIAVVLGAVWAWLRWNPLKTWITFVPLLLLVGLYTAGESARFLPNLL